MDLKTKQDIKSLESYHQVPSTTKEMIKFKDKRQQCEQAVVDNQEVIQVENADEVIFLDYLIVKEEYKVQEELSETVTKTYHCAICAMKFPSRYRIENHMLRHSTKKDFKCLICPKSFAVESFLTSHMKCHAENLKLPCHLCDKVFKNTRTLQTHQRVHDPNYKATFGCDICGKKLKAKGDLKNHIKRVHFGLKRKEIPKKQNVPCKFCGKIFGRIGHYNVHLKRIHSEDEKLPCPTCKKIFRNNITLTEHLKYYHKERNAFHTCKICKREFRRKYILAEHLERHKRGLKILHKCSYCTTNVANLEKHMEEKHRGFPMEKIFNKFILDGPICCSICNSTHKNAKSLKMHVQKTHPIKKIQYTCDICKKTITGKISLKNHMNYHLKTKSRNKINTI